MNKKKQKTDSVIEMSPEATIRTLRKELHEVQEERDVLKKAMAIFSKT